MSRRRRSDLVGGIILVLLGGYFLLSRIFPEIRIWEQLEFAWPFFVIGAGVLLFILGILTGAPGMAVPATIVTGIGGLLYWQNATGNWESWSYAWALIPGFVGVGTLLMGLLGEDPRGSFRSGITLIIISLILFAIFGSLLGGLPLLGPYWPLLLVLLGLWILVQALFSLRKAQ